MLDLFNWNILVSYLCYVAMLSSFIVVLSEWTVMSIHADYTE